MGSYRLGWETERSENSATGETEGGRLAHRNRATEAIVELEPTKEPEPLEQGPWIHPHAPLASYASQ